MKVCRGNIEVDFFGFYDVLERNESINIPLFVVDGSDVKDVGDFNVQFFTVFTVEDFAIEDSGFPLDGWDVLRWRVFGVNEGKTSAISDFTAVSLAQKSQSDVESSFETNAQYPSWFGTVSCGGQSNRYTDKIECLDYWERWDSSSEGSEEQQIIYCDHTQAREHYVYDSYGALDEGQSLGKCYPIKQFIEEHSFNYLTLTNLINPGVFEEGVDKDALSRLYFRVELFEDSSDEDSGNQTVQNVAKITSTGITRNSNQNIRAYVRRGSFMPVFYFSLYSTYRGGE